MQNCVFAYFIDLNQLIFSCFLKWNSKNEGPLSGVYTYDMISPQFQSDPCKTAGDGLLWNFNMGKIDIFSLDRQAGGFGLTLTVPAQCRTQLASTSPLPYVKKRAVAKILYTSLDILLV